LWVSVGKLRKREENPRAPVELARELMLEKCSTVAQEIGWFLGGLGLNENRKSLLGI